MKKRMIIVTALIMGTLGAGCVSVQASDTLPELTKDNALEQMMKAGETDSLVSNHKAMKLPVNIYCRIQRYMIMKILK